MRQELAPQGIEVTALHVGYLDTDMSDYVDQAQKSDPAEVAAAALDGLAAGAAEVLAAEASEAAGRYMDTLLSGSSPGN